jgi:hypothetical protein
MLRQDQQPRSANAICSFFKLIKELLVNPNERFERSGRRSFDNAHGECASGSKKIAYRFVQIFRRINRKFIYKSQKRKNSVGSAESKPKAVKKEK